MKKTYFLLTMMVFLTACTSPKPLNAPCDEHATFCGQKTKINHW